MAGARATSRLELTAVAVVCGAKHMLVELLFIKEKKSVPQGSKRVGLDLLYIPNSIRDAVYL